ncbi:MAG: hypothetical protein AB7G28_26720, partial [Pirellulales bacterium]
EIEEPIWKAVRENWTRFAKKWNGQDEHSYKPFTKGLIVFVAVMAIFQFGGQVAAMAVPVAVCYGVYYVIWLTLIKPSGVHQVVEKIDNQVAAAVRGDASASPTAMTAAWNPPSSATPASPASKYAKKIRDRRLRPNWRDRVQQEVSVKPTRDKFSELFGSMLLSALFASLAALVAPVLLGLATSSVSMAVYLWLALVGTLGSWAILIPAKFTEGKLEDQGPIRVLMLALGGIVGAAAWLLADVLIVQIPGGVDPLDAHWGLISQDWLHWMTPENGNPSLPMFVTYFAFLFMILRWWRQAEFTRNQRLSLWSIAVCVFAAWLMQFFWQFPQPAGMLVAGVTAFATQLASPWLPPSKRRVSNTEADQTA